jgi:hypothetical protein
MSIMRCRVALTIAVGGVGTIILEVATYTYHDLYNSRFRVDL